MLFSWTMRLLETLEKFWVFFLLRSIFLWEKAVLGSSPSFWLWIVLIFEVFSPVFSEGVFVAFLVDEGVSKICS